MGLIPNQAIKFAIPKCTADQATTGLCNVLRKELFDLNTIQSKLQSLSFHSVLGMVQNIASEEIGSNVVNAVTSIMEGYTSEFISQVGSKVVKEAQKVAMTVLGFVGLIVNGKSGLLLAICQIIRDDLDETLVEFKLKSQEAVALCIEIDDLMADVSDLGTHYPKIKEKLSKAEQWLSRAERQMTYLYNDMAIARKSVSDRHYSLAQSYLYIAKHHICPEHGDKYEEIGKRAFSIAQSYGFSNFGDILGDIWKESGDSMIKAVFQNIVHLYNKTSELFTKIDELSALSDRINFLKNSIVFLNLGEMLSEGLFGDKLGLNKMVSRYIYDLIQRVHTMREEILEIVNKDKIGKTELTTNQLKWCNTLKLILSSIENCIIKRMVDTGSASAEILTGYNDYIYMVYPHDPSDNIPSLTETSNFSLATSFSHSLKIKMSVYGLATRGPSYINSMRTMLNTTKEEITQYKNKSSLMRTDIANYTGYGDEIILRLSELLRNVSLDRAADLLLSGNLSEFSQLTYLTANYIGAAVDCLKTIYSGLKTSQEKIVVDNSIRKLYIENRTLNLSNLSIEQSIQEYNKEIAEKISGKESEINQFC